MRADGVVKGFEFPEQVIQVTLAKDDKMIEAFGLGGANVPFSESIQIGRPVGNPHHFDAFALDDGFKARGELRIAVVDQGAGAFVPLPQLVEEVSGLLLHPGAIGVTRCAGDPNAACANVDKEQDVVGDLPPSRPHVLGEEVAGPQRFICKPLRR